MINDALDHLSAMDSEDDFEAATERLKKAHALIAAAVERRTGEPTTSRICRVCSALQ
jgi:hypothetical protein